MQFKLFALIMFCASQLTGFAQGSSETQAETQFQTPPQTQAQTPPQTLPPTHPKALAREDLRGKSAEERAEFITDRLSTHLSLSTEQKSQIYLLQLSFHEKVDQIRQSNAKAGVDTRPTPEMRQEISKEKQALDANINDLLNEAQRSKIEKHKRHRIEGEHGRQLKGENYGSKREK